MQNLVDENDLFVRYISENVPSYVKQNIIHSKRQETAIILNFFVHPNGLTVSIEIFNLHLWSNRELFF